MNSAHSQSQYQVRFDWGVAGAAAVSRGVDAFVVVDVLSSTTANDIVASLAGLPALVAAGSLRNGRAVAEWVLQRQEEKADRFVVAVIAAGETREDGSIRFAVEDLLASGAIIDALADVGIDYNSPEAAAAASAFSGLRNAVGHLTSASASGRELIEMGRSDEVARAAELDASREVPLLA